MAPKTPTTPTTPATLLQSPLVWLGTFAVVLGAALYYPLFFPDDARTVTAQGEQFFFRVNDGAGAPVLVLSLWLFYRRSHLRDVLSGNGAVKLGALVLVLTAALFGWGVFTTAPDLRLASVMGLLAGVALLLGGRSTLRAYWLPILFLGFALPISPVLIATTIFPIQLVTAEISGLILNGLGFDSLIQGDQILRLENRFIVVEACSGIRTAVTLSMLTILLIDLFERRGWHAAVLMVLAPFVAFATNTIRVVTLVLNPHSNIHSIHNLQGILMLLVGLTLIYFIDGWVARGLGSREPESEDADYGPRQVEVASRAARAISIGAVVLVLFAMLAMDQFVPRWPAEGKLEETPRELMARVFGADPMAPYAVDYKFMGSVQYLAHARHRVEVSGDSVEIHLGVANERLRQHSILSKRLAWPASGFVPIEEEFVELGSDRTRARRMLFRRGATSVLSYSMILRREGLGSEWFRKAAALDRSPFARPGHPIAVRLSTSLGPGESGPAEAEDRIRQIWRRLAPEIENYARVAPALPD
jgi:exosortase